MNIAPWIVVWIVGFGVAVGVAIPLAYGINLIAGTVDWIRQRRYDKDIDRRVREMCETEKAEHPERYCPVPGCLHCLGVGDCPDHTWTVTVPLPAEIEDEDDEGVWPNAAAIRAAEEAGYNDVM